MIAAVLRQATLDEADEIARVFIAARRAVLDVVPMVHPAEDAPRFIRSLFMKQSIHVAIIDHRIVGMMALSPGWIEHLYIEPDFCGRGIGSALLAEARRSAEGSKGLTLWTFQANRRARRFYERQGFRAVEFGDGSAIEEKAPDMRYEWEPPATA